MEQRLTMDNIKLLYPPSEYIHIVPSVSKHHLGPNMYGIDVATLKIDPQDEKMVYPLKEEGWDEDRRVTEVGLTALAVNRIAGMADVTVVPHYITDAPGLLVVQQQAIMRTPGGDVRGRACIVRWEADVMRDEILLNAEMKVARGIKAKWKGYTEERRQELIDFNFRKEWIRERKYGPRSAESKAARNAVKHLLAISDSYDPRELYAKEFCVVKFVFAPDLSDPDVKRMVIESGLRAQKMLYGSGVAQSTGMQFLPAPDESRIIADQSQDEDPDAGSRDGGESVEAEDEDGASAETAVDADEEDWAQANEPMVKAVTARLQELRISGVGVEKLDTWYVRFSDIMMDQDAAGLRALAVELRKAVKKD